MERNKNSGPDSRDTRGEENKDLPGYPYYPPEEDIMNPKNGLHKVKADVEELPNSRKLAIRVAKELENKPPDPDEDTNADSENSDDLGIIRGTAADVTRDDLLILGDKDSDQDLGDDEIIKPKERVDDVENEKDLDVPGQDLDDTEEYLGEEDEENNYYSLGGDRHEDLEEDQANVND